MAPSCKRHLPSDERRRVLGRKKVEDRRLRRELRQHVGVVFQNPEHQFLAPTIEEELAISLESNRERMDEVMEQFSLHRWRDIPIHHLSLGQKNGYRLR